ncbi:thiamine pyrophosphate-binding protein [Streptomyces sp. NBC_01483]|uniref:thiamine pyrophosphate-binding protein n=1 Tax=Streptomyces sp. NBC_01483 TaxID=2903883 RepID=UPI002E321DAC|nr:thiamine pyrophosphate-binding protein [Streptomyces sp. NBC_01483]
MTYDLLRTLKLTTVFGNPGSTEQTFLQDFPEDFTYVLALQEASVIAMADAFAQVTRRPALVNLHSSAGVGNAVGNLVAAYHGNTPLIITSGQQHRELLIGEPYLGNREATTLPKPWVKWSYEPARAEDVPEAFMRAYAEALQPPAGPVYLSIPMDDWKRPLSGFTRVRAVSDRVAPDTERLRGFADRISASRRPALVFGPEVDRSGGWDAAVALAEKLRASVYGAPLLDRASFPENHALFRGPLGMSVKTISDRLAGHDLVVARGVVPHGRDAVGGRGCAQRLLGTVFSVRTGTLGWGRRGPHSSGGAMSWIRLDNTVNAARECPGRQAVMRGGSVCASCREPGGRHTRKASVG